MSTLSLVDLIQRSLKNYDSDILPVVQYLGLEINPSELKKDNERHLAVKIEKSIREAGSNDLATIFRGEGVPYNEVVLDVGNKIGAKVSKDYSVEDNEKKILWKMFEDTLDKLNDSEKRELLASLGIKEHEIPLGSTAAFLIPIIMKHYGGFAVYQVSLIVANTVSRALLGKGLSFAANATITRVIGTALGPIGWIATGLWLAIDIAGPAYRKTVPTVVHIAMLRQMIKTRITFGVVGDGSTGKDALMSAVFNQPSHISSIAGSTDDAEAYTLSEKGNVTVVNYPGFNDYRPRVSAFTDNHLNHTDIFIMVVDILRGISDTDIKIVKRLEDFKRPILICLNKVDLVRGPEQLEELNRTAKERLGSHLMINTAFDPDTRISKKNVGVTDVQAWIIEMLTSSGKSDDVIKQIKTLFGQ